LVISQQARACFTPIASVRFSKQKIIYNIVSGVGDDSFTGKEELSKRRLDKSIQCRGKKYCIAAGKEQTPTDTAY